MAKITIELVDVTAVLDNERVFRASGVNTTPDNVLSEARLVALGKFAQRLLAEQIKDNERVGNASSVAE